MKKTSFSCFAGILLPVIIPVLLSLGSCNRSVRQEESQNTPQPYSDDKFIQEYHEAYMVGKSQAENEVRSIAVGHDSVVWIATAAGIYRKNPGEVSWEPVISGADRGPSYSVVVNKDGDLLMGTWNGLYRYSQGKISKENGPEPPVSEIC